MTKYDCSSADVNPIGGISKVDLTPDTNPGPHHSPLTTHHSTFTPTPTPSPTLTPTPTPTLTPTPTPTPTLTLTPSPTPR